MGLGKNLRQILHDRWMTQKQLSDMVGCDDTTISKLISGARSNPSVELVKKIADALELTVDELISDKPIINKKEV